MFFEIANLVDAVVGSAVYLNDVKTTSLADGPARFTFIARFGSRFGRAVYRFCKETRNGGLSTASRAGKKIGMTYRAAFNSTCDHANCADWPTTSENFCGLYRL